jgi:pullulanase
MTTAAQIKANIKFIPTTNEVIAYTINGAAVKDSAKTILVIHNPNPGPSVVTLPTKSKWSVLVKGALAGTKTIETLNSKTITIQGQTTMVLKQ